MARARAAGMTLMISAAIILSHFVAGGHDAQRMVQLGFLGLGGIYMVASGRAPALAWFGSGATRCGLALLLILGVISSLMSDSPVHALREVLLLALLLLCALCVAQELSADYAPRLTVVLGILGAGMALYTFKLGVIWTTAIVTQSQPDSFALAPGFSNYRFLNHAQTVILPLLVLAACRCSPARRWLWLAVAAFTACSLLTLGGRGSVLGLAAGLVTAIVLQRGRAGYFCKTFMLVALCGAVLWLFLCVWIPRAAGLQPFGDLLQVVARSTGNEMTSYRDVLWNRSLVYIAAHPWLGIGPAHFGRYAFDLNIASHPHNWPLQIAAEWGIAALLCLLAVIGTAARQLFKAAKVLDLKDSQNHLILTALIVTGVAILVDGLVSGLIVMPVSQLLIALYIGCAAGWVQSLKPRLAVYPGRSTRLAVAAVLIISLAGLALGAAHDFPGGKAGAAKPHPATTFPQPRFWDQEYFNDAQLRQAAQCGHGAARACP